MKHFDTTQMNVIKNGVLYLGNFDMDAKQTSFSKPNWVTGVKDSILFPSTYFQGTSDDAWAVMEQLQEGMISAELEVKTVHVTYETRVTDIEEVEE